MTTTATKERPLIFTAESVNAIRAGGKTQTRRIVKPQPVGFHHSRGVPLALKSTIGSAEYVEVHRPFAVGQRLWVKEAVWRDKRDANGVIYAATPEWGKYADDAEPRRLCGFGDEWISREESARNLQANTFWKRKSPLYMPRWASRLTLEITGVRAERVADISEEDAKAEGMREWTKDGKFMKYWPCDPCDGKHKRAWVDLPHSAVEAFGLTWDIINGKKPGCDWASNPFVWALTFRVVDDGGVQ